MSHRKNIAHEIAQATDWYVSPDPHLVAANEVGLVRSRGPIEHLPNPVVAQWIGYLMATLLFPFHLGFIAFGVVLIALGQYVKYLNPGYTIYFLMTLQEESGRITVYAPGRYSRETQIVREYCIAHGLDYRYGGERAVLD